MEGEVILYKTIEETCDFIQSSGIAFGKVDKSR
jgi:hypothetical protein